MDHAIHGGSAFPPDRTRVGAQWNDAMSSSGVAGFHPLAVGRHTRCEPDKASRCPA